MSNRDRAAEVLYLHEQSRRLVPRTWRQATKLAKLRCLSQADALIEAGLIHVGHAFCTKFPNCSLLDGHADGCRLS